VIRVLATSRGVVKAAEIAPFLKFNFRIKILKKSLFFGTYQMQLHTKQLDKAHNDRFFLSQRL
jgi:hypothetical protein